MASSNGYGLPSLEILHWLRLDLRMIETLSFKFFRQCL